MVHAARFKADICRRFAEHWAALPRDGLLPRLSDFLNRPMPDFQPKVAIADVLSDADIRYRLVGTDLVEGFGAERTGQNILDVTAPKLRPKLLAMFRAVLAQPCGVRCLVTAATTRDREVSFETVCLPLRRGGGQPAAIVGFNETLDALDFDEHLIQFLDQSDLQWLDIGAGRPAGLSLRR